MSRPLPPCCSLRAPAKVNLFLQVSGRRSDGYHELQTVFHAIDLCDELVARPTARAGQVDLVIETADAAGGRRGLPVHADDQNLVVRAAQAHLRDSGAAARGGMEFVLRKRIPAGGGLGGGSSDAAAALRLCERISGGAVGDARLHELAAGLGADVPFFLRGGTQLGTGTGTALRPLPDLSLELILVLPPFGTSTVAVYQNHEPQLNNDVPLTTLRDIEARFVDGLRSRADLRNDLEAAAMRACPPLESLWSRIEGLGIDGLRLSGSGATMFVVAGSSAEAESCAAKLAVLEPDCGVQRVRSAGAAEIERAAWPSLQDEESR